MKLASLKKKGNGTVSIVHIGDSHLQAGFISGVVRNGLQEFFGNAGRGLVFPYQLAESNAPDDITSSSNTRWKYNRIAHPEIELTPGISGFGIESASNDAYIYLSLKQINTSSAGFNNIRLFTGKNSTLAIRADFGDSTYVLDSTSGNSLIDLNKNSTGFHLTNLSSNRIAAFYGASLRERKPWRFVSFHWCKWRQV